MEKSFRFTRGITLLRMYLDYLDSCKALSIEPIYKDFAKFMKAYKNVKLNYKKYE